MTVKNPQELTEEWWCSVDAQTVYMVINSHQKETLPATSSQKSKNI